MEAATEPSVAQPAVEVDSEEDVVRRQDPLLAGLLVLVVLLLLSLGLIIAIASNNMPADLR